MYIGCNWSNELRYLLEKDVVQIDYIKSGAYGDFNERFLTMRSMKPILIHGLGYYENTGMKNAEIVDFDAANGVIEKSQSPHYGLHLAILNTDMTGDMTEEKMYSHMCKQIQIFKKNLKVPLLLENSPDTPCDRTVFDLYPYILPEQIHRILEENEVDFLLDLSHAKLTAQYRKWDIYEYLSEMPLNRIKEIHTNGSGYDKEGFPKDTHQAMEEEDYKLLEWVLGHSNPQIVTLEYNGIEGEEEKAVLYSLEKQLNRIQNICNG